jgi:solute:Na+ symporter, SSS family
VDREAGQEGIQLRLSGAGDNLPNALLCVLLAAIAIYSGLFAIGFGLYGNTLLSVGLLMLAAIAVTAVIKLWQKN